MSVQVEQAPPGVVAAYLNHPARAPYDEFVAAEGVRSHQQLLAATVDAMGTAGLLAARAETRTFVADEGVTYGSASLKNSRMWAIDPIPVQLDTAEWDALAAGLTQRAEALDLVFSDLYGERRLLSRKVLPAAAVLGHPGFLRAAHQSTPLPGRQLLLTGTDLGRDSSGVWRALSDRTGAPAGAGYAMITRRIVSRVMAGLHRGSDLARLRRFFQTVTAALMDAAPSAAESPRVVVLSAGTSSRTTFDASFLATMLGFDVVEADDLLTSRGRPWLRAGDRLEPVDVILSRVDALMSDPLEFRGNSEVGLPGMVEASRGGTVRLANPVGADVLDNPALLAHLGPVMRALLGADPLLSGPQTWWCGEPSALSHVLTHLEGLVIKPIGRDHAPARFGWQLSAEEANELRARLQAEPWAWCGQERMELSTTPVITSTGLEPRRFVLRTFGVAAGDGYQFLPGGLGRVTTSVHEYTTNHRAGMLAKDVWVPSTAQEPPGTRPRLSVVVAPRPVQVTPRVAGTLYGIGRHAERAESTARLLLVADDLSEDHSSRPGTPGARAMEVLNTVVTEITGIERSYAEAPTDYLRRITLDAGLPGGVHYSARILSGRAQQVRDLMSVDTWSVLGRLDRTLEAAVPLDQPLQPLVENVLESLLAHAGIVAHSMVRDSSWAFLDAGGRLERARHTVAVLRASIRLARGGPAEEVTAEAVLRACESVITHRRRAAAGTGPVAAVDSAIALLVEDVSNPRSVAHQLVAVAADLILVDDRELAAQAEDLLRGLADETGHEDVLAWLTELGDALAGLDARIARRHFVRQARRHTAESDWSGGRR